MTKPQFENLKKRLPLVVRRKVRKLYSLPIEKYYQQVGYPMTGAHARFRMFGPVPPDYRYGTYESDVKNFILANITSGWTCLDIGAHLGYFTLLMASLVEDSGRVYAFEGHPENAGWFRTNLTRNRLNSKVVVENIVISESGKSTACLYPGRRRSFSEWNIVGHDVAGKSTKPELIVSASSLDEYFDHEIVIDFIKLDIEGAEHLALQGAKRILKESRPIALVEFHNNTGWSGRHALLAEGYRLYDLSNHCWINELAAPVTYHCLAVPAEKSASVSL